VSNRWSLLDAPNVAYLWSKLLIEELVRNGVETFFIAPGSRSTPLTMCAARHPDADVVLHVDERGTAFSALGVGRATRHPAAWITTSGTAVANGLPAVVEASIDDVPMVLLTADRPPELRDTGANQTIDQIKIYGDYVRWEADLPPPTADVDPAYVLTTTDQAVYQASRPPAGPVHLNCSFRKPLEPVESDAAVSIPDPVRQWGERETPFTRYPIPRLQSGEAPIAELHEAVSEADRGLVVVGRLDTEEEATAVTRLSERLGWPLLPDVTSRLRLRNEGRRTKISYADLILTSDAFRTTTRPDVVLQVGGRFVSKRLRRFLRDAAPSVRAVVRPSPSRVDPDHRATHHVETTIESFVAHLLTDVDVPSASSDWLSAWTAADECVDQVVRTHAEESGSLTEPLVARCLTRHAPSTHALVAASSMPVRDLNRHGAPGSGDPAFANRGASGIDGTVATAAGVAHGREGPVTLLLGDLALWHDLNSLALLQNRPVVVIVVNNDGGGIFHFLPIREHEEVFEPYFTTPQGRSFASAASTFGIAYDQPTTPEAFRSAYTEACSRGGPTLIEVQTDREGNRQIHQTLEENIAAAVAGSM